MQKDKHADRANRWRLCRLSNLELLTPIVVCLLGGFALSPTCQLIRAFHILCKTAAFMNSFLPFQSHTSLLPQPLQQGSDPRVVVASQAGGRCGWHRRHAAPHRALTGGAHSMPPRRAHPDTRSEPSTRTQHCYPHFHVDSACKCKRKCSGGDASGDARDGRECRRFRRAIRVPHYGPRDERTS